MSLSTGLYARFLNFLKRNPCFVPQFPVPSFILQKFKANNSSRVDWPINESPLPNFISGNKMLDFSSHNPYSIQYNTKTKGTRQKYCLVSWMLTSLICFHFEAVVNFLLPKLSATFIHYRSNVRVTFSEKRRRRS